MDRKILTAFLAALLSTSVQVSGWGETYRGAVVEYHPELGTNNLDTMQRNAKNFVEFIAKAKKKEADIIVFPEFGLFSRETSAIPDPVDKISPCDSEFETSKAVKDISCASKEHRIYSVINLPEKRTCEPGEPNCPSGFHIYNTNVVFDRNGVVIARYAKYNLFESDAVEKPAEPDLVFFDTDFGVRFGTFICFDIIFADPTLRLVQQYGITDFVFSTYWFGELPFLTGLQAQRGWAEANNVNLLASGVNIPRTGSAGSGIYNGKYGHLVQVMSENATSKLLIADIPRIRSPWERTVTGSRSVGSIKNVLYLRNSPRREAEIASDDGLTLLTNPQLNTSTTEIIKGGEKFEKTICSNNNFCCDFKVTMNALLPGAKNYTYRAMVYDGIRPFGSKTRGGVQLCGVVVCNGTKLEDCGYRVKKIPTLFEFKEILIKGKFKGRNSFQMPSTLTDGEAMAPLPANRYIFTRVEEGNSKDVSMELVWPVYDLHTFAIWGRDFSRDNLPFVPQSGASASVSAPLLFTSFVCFFLFFR